MTDVRRAPRPGLAEMPMLPPGFAPYGKTMQGPEPMEHKGSLSDLTLTPKQLLCVHSKADERFFGGAKGVGKSLVCLADFAAAEQMHGGSARGLMVRQTFSEFRWLITMAGEVYQGIARWNANDDCYEWESGAKLYLGHLQHDSHLTKYQGNPYTHLYFDELPEWPSPHQYLFMHSLMRSTDRAIKARMLSTGNPGRPGQGWVHSRFVRPMPEYHLYIDPFTKLSRQFIPARLEDNPHIDPEEYDKMLRSAASNNRQLYLAFRYGDWSSPVGQAFEEWDEDLHVCPKFDPPIEWQRIAAIDWGTRKPYAILYFAIAPDGHVYIYNEDYGCQEGMYDVGVNLSGKEVARRAATYAFGQGFRTMIIDSSMKDELGHGFTIADQFQEEGWTLLEASKDRIAGKNAVHALLQTRIMSDDLPMLRVMEHCEHFRRTFPALVYNDRNESREEDVDSRGEDHLYDAAAVLRHAA